MKRKNTTRNALLTSIISLLLCVSMLVGTTFAWFTDEVKSGTNIIAAGNLDVELYHGKDQNPVDQVKEDTLLFTDAGGNVIDQWEPGVVAYTNLKVANVGTLALKYLLSINSTEMNYVQYTDGSIYTLADALKVAVVKDGISGDRAAVVAAGTASGWEGLKSFTLSGELNSKEESDTYGIVIYWEPGENDNLFNMNNGKVTSDGEALTITLGVNLFATQEMYEDDSFGADYDKLAPWTGKADTEWYNETATEFTITSAEELAGLAQIVNSGKDTFNGKTVKLAANIDLNNAPWTPIGKSGRATEFNGTFIGTGYTISNLYVTGTKYVGLFGATYTGAHIEGVTIDGAYVSGNDYVGAVVGGGYLSANCIKDCTVKSAKIIATPYLKADGVTYDGGAKAGAIVGSAYNGNLTGNKAIDCEITAYRDLGGIAGMLYSDGVTGRTLTASGNTVEKVTLTYLDLGGAAYDGDKVNENMGDVVGRLGKTDGATAPVVENNTVTNVTRNAVIYWVENGAKYSKDVDTGAVTFEGLAAEFEGDTVTLRSDTSNIASYAFSQTSVKTVILNEGLKSIENRAFQKMPNMTSITIPSTVEFIGEYAFQGSKLVTLVVPESVTRIDQAAFAYSTTLETIIIEGSPVIGESKDATNKTVNYVARACTNLKTVVLAGDDITFATKGITFANAESGTMDKITFYVANETVKSKLLEATNTLKAEKVIVGVYSTAEELATAVANGATNIYLLDGEYDVYSCGGKTLTISGSKNAVLKVMHEHSDGYDGGFDSSNITFNGVTIDSTANNGQYPGYVRMNGTYNNCTINGQYTLYGVSEFNNCTFNISGDKYSIWTWGATDATFNGCTFNSDGKSILLYSTVNTNLTVNNCVFNDNGGLTDLKAAIEVGDDYGKSYTLTVNNTTVNGYEINDKGINTGTTLWGNKNSLNNDRLKVTVDGKTFVSNGLYTDDAGNYYVYNAAGLQSLKTWMDSKANSDFWGKTYNIMADIDASTVTWNTKHLSPDSSYANGITFNGNDHTISNLTINGQGLFTGATKGGNGTVVSTFKNITFDNVTVVGGTHHNGVIWGEAYGSLTLEKVSVINSKVSGGCNVGGLVGRNSESHATFIFKDCAVKNTTVEATKKADNAGASAFLGMALHIGNSCSANVIFEGTNVAEGNTLTTAEGMQGGGIYAIATWDASTWDAPTVVNDFTNYNSNN